MTKQVQTDREFIADHQRIIRGNIAAALAVGDVATANHLSWIFDNLLSIDLTVTTGDCEVGK
jgi:hypothetical protein